MHAKPMSASLHTITCQTIHVPQLVVHVLCFNSRFCVGRVIGQCLIPALASAYLHSLIFLNLQMHAKPMSASLHTISCQTIHVPQLVVHVLCFNTRFCVGRVIGQCLIPALTYANLHSLIFPDLSQLANACLVYVRQSSQNDLPNHPRASAGSACALLQQQVLRR